MTDRTETNVRLPWCAVDALAAAGARRGTSRDATLRQLLTEHVEFQEGRDPDDRLTHVSTVLRYPPPPRSRHDPRTDRPVRLRADRDLLERARAHSLTLPGQHRRSHRDYQARALTDAVMTAIAVAEPFTDEVLDGLLPLLRHRAALGLWRLTTAGTSTGPERDLLIRAENIRSGLAWQTTPDTDGTTDPAAERQLLLAAEALEEEVGWHSPARFEKAAALARRLLAGPGTAAREQMLYEQGPAWEERYQDALQAAVRPPMTLHGLEYDWTGRGGTAVWRAHRTVAVQDFEDWLLSPPSGKDAPASHVVSPPGWLLRAPAGWHAYAPRETEYPAGPYEQWVADGRILAFPYKGRQALWPVTSADTGPSGWEPVPGAEPLAAAAQAHKLRPEAISAFIEAVLIDWSHTYEEDPSLRIVLDLPPDLARRFGFLTSQQHAAMAEARAATLQHMDEIIEAFRDDGLGEPELQELRQLRGNTRAFRRQATRRSKFIAAKFRLHRPSWSWPGPSAAEYLLTGSRKDLVQALAVQALAVQAYRSRSLTLEASMQEAWQRAFDRYGRRV